MKVTCQSSWTQAREPEYLYPCIHRWLSPGHDILPRIPLVVCASVPTGGEGSGWLRASLQLLLTRHTRKWQRDLSECGWSSDSTCQALSVMTPISGEIRAEADSWRYGLSRPILTLKVIYQRLPLGCLLPLLDFIWLPIKAKHLETCPQIHKLSLHVGQAFSVVAQQMLAADGLGFLSPLYPLLAEELWVNLPKFSFFNYFTCKMESIIFPS